MLRFKSDAKRRTAIHLCNRRPRWDYVAKKELCVGSRSSLSIEASKTINHTEHHARAYEVIVSVEKEGITDPSMPNKTNNLGHNPGSIAQWKQTTDIVFGDVGTSNMNIRVNSPTGGGSLRGLLACSTFLNYAYTILIYYLYITVWRWFCP